MLPISPAGRRYGRWPDNPFNPARGLLALRADPAVALPPKAATSQWMGSIRDQGQEGSCTGQMKAEYRDWMYRKLYQYEKDKTVPVDQFKASADFAYLTNLIHDGNLGQDAGSTIHTSFLTLNQQGCALESQEPYSDTDYTTAPTVAQYAEALTYKGGPYHYLPSLQDMKSCIASGYAFGFGFLVYSSFESDPDFPNTGFMPMPAPVEGILGGHAQISLDFDDTIVDPAGTWPTPGAFLIQNSWGDQWGISAPGRTDRGCYWMPYSFFTKVDPTYGACVSDAWICHLGKW
jgi:C1A family cysteine protease